MKTSVRCTVFFVASLVFALSGASLASAASPWSVGLGTGSYGLARSGPVPASAPAGPASACTSLIAGTTVNVTWSAVTAPSNGNPVLSYTVYESNTTVGGTYFIAQTGVTTTSWTSPSLVVGHYWFEVSAVYGNNWVGPASAATSERTIAVVLIVPLCT
jgi:hypothetical protein